MGLKASIMVSAICFAAEDCAELFLFVASPQDHRHPDNSVSIKACAPTRPRDRAGAMTYRHTESIRWARVSRDHFVQPLPTEVDFP